MTTEDLVKFMAQHIQSRLPWVDDLRWIGRKDPTGVIHGTDEYLGLDTSSGNNGYFRYEGDDHKYAVPSKKLTSVMHTEVTASLKFVFLHQCTNEDAIEDALWNELMLAPIIEGAPDFKVFVGASSKDLQMIFTEETGEVDCTNTKWKMISFDLKVSYLRVVTLDPNCIPACDVC